MLQPFTIHSITSPINIIQGPLAGVSCSPFRRLVHQYSQPAYSYTEMMSCKTLIQGHQALLKRYVNKDAAEGLVCFQLSGNDVNELAEAVKIATDLGADLIDLNAGCPVPKIRKKGAGSRLLADSSHLFQLVSAMRQSTHLPVSLKIRVDGNSGDRFNHELARVIGDAGCDVLVVHGRHWSDDYETPCYYDQIRFFVDQLAIPVIGNGDVADLDSLRAMFATGCAGVMVSRATVGRPWLIAQWVAESKGEQYRPPGNDERAKMFIEHVEQLADLLGSEGKALYECRQFAKYYVRHLPNYALFLQTLYQLSSLECLKRHCLAYFNNGTIEIPDHAHYQ